MFALIYDTHELDKPQKRVISVHKSRETAERVLGIRMARLGKKVEECNTRIVWVKRKVQREDVVIDKDFSTWKPGEKIPYGELHPDCD
ncbi:hypothetical protein [Desulfosarcina sp.]|uniref:hypothetical protein n=1 Tax=Desulfosarcina sp. TaxID=2027861 RepID=UPI003569020B